MLPLRLRRVVGLEGRSNDVLFQPAAARPPDTQHTVVFFGGDVQDYPEIMQGHRDNRNYVRWNLESTARMLADNFPDRHILVVRPSRIEYKSFSCYDNFVPCNKAGVPDHTPHHGALLHLDKLLQGVTSRLNYLPTQELLQACSAAGLPEHIDVGHTGTSKSNGSTAHADVTAGGSSRDKRHKPTPSALWWLDRLALDQNSLTLIGFSKGCVVLNQLIYEFHYTKTLTPGDETMMRFIERIREMWWLDGGHAGGSNTWITSRSLLETLTRLNVSVCVVVSPYQVSDAARPWIGREERAFTHTLTRLGATISRFLHEPSGLKHCLQMHFDVLENFKRIRDSNPATLPPAPSDTEDNT